MDSCNKKSIGQRLLDERKHLNLTQLQVAKICGVAKSTAMFWERNSNIKATDLATLSTHGFDIQYIVTGRHALNLNPDAIKKLQHPDNTKEWRFVGDFLGFINLIMEKK